MPQPDRCDLCRHYAVVWLISGEGVCDACVRRYAQQCTACQLFLWAEYVNGDGECPACVNTHLQQTGSTNNFDELLAVLGFKKVPL